MHVATMSDGCVSCMRVQTACHGCTKTARIGSVLDKWTNTVASVFIVAKKSYVFSDLTIINPSSPTDTQCKTSLRHEVRLRQSLLTVDW